MLDVLSDLAEDDLVLISQLLPVLTEQQILDWVDWVELSEEDDVDLNYEELKHALNEQLQLIESAQVEDDETLEQSVPLNPSKGSSYGSVDEGGNSLLDSNTKEDRVVEALLLLGGLQLDKTRGEIIESFVDESPDLADDEAGMRYKNDKERFK